MSERAERVSNKTVFAAVIKAKGEKTLDELADGLGMKPGTLRAQVNRIRKEVAEAAKEANKEVKFPSIKDGRSATNSSNGAELLAMLTDV